MLRADFQVSLQDSSVPFLCKRLFLNETGCKTETSTHIPQRWLLFVSNRSTKASKDLSTCSYGCHSKTYIRFHVISIAVWIPFMHRRNHSKMVFWEVNCDGRVQGWVSLALFVFIDKAVCRQFGDILTVVVLTGHEIKSKQNTVFSTDWVLLTMWSELIL